MDILCGFLDIPWFKIDFKLKIYGHAVDILGTGWTSPFWGGEVFVDVPAGFQGRSHARAF